MFIRKEKTIYENVLRIIFYFLYCNLFIIQFLNDQFFRQAWSEDQAKIKEEENGNGNFCGNYRIQQLDR